jgi:hypothetical protein
LFGLKGGSNARQESKRQEREAIRRVEAERNVEVARREDREFARIIQPRGEEVGLQQLVSIEVEELIKSRRNVRAEEGSWPQGRQGKRPELIPRPYGAVKTSEPKLSGSGDSA